MRYFIGILTFLALGVHSHLIIGQTWEQIAPYPEPRIFATAFVIDDVPYVGTSDNELSDTFYKYNADTDSWSEISRIPIEEGQGRDRATAFSINGKGYVIGGRRPMNYPTPNEVYEYDPTTDTWTRKNDFPENISIFLEAPLSFVIDDKAYLLTSITQDIYEYNQEDDSWTKKSRFPGSATLDQVAFAANGKGYIGLGFGSEGATKELWEYDPSTDTWQQKSPFPGDLGRNNAVAFVLDGIAYVGMGIGPLIIFNTFYAYDPSTDSWSDVPPAGYASTYGVAFSAGGYGYVGLGFNGQDGLGEFWRFSPITTNTENLTIDDIDIYPNPAQNTLTIDNNAQHPIQYISITNVAGQKILESATPTVGQLSIAALPRGVYILNIVLDNGNQLVQRKFIKT